MKIPINLIKPSPNPVRTQWDEEKLNELAQSIKEQGLIVPIKVRPIINATWLEPASQAKERQNILMEHEFLGDEFEIIYGHRRVEACLRAGLTEIEVIIEEVNRIDQLVQALIENLQREDMEPVDIAKALKALKGLTNWSNHDLERHGVMKEPSIREYLTLLYQPDDVQKMVTRARDGRVEEGKITPRHIRVAKHAGLSNEDASCVVRKAAQEGLTTKQTESIAKSIHAAPSEQAKQRLLDWEYSPTIHDPEFIRQRAKEHGPHDPIYRDPKPTQQDQWDNTPEIKMLLEGFAMAIKTFIELMNQIHKVTDVGKLAPEGRQFIAAKLKSFRNKIDLLLEGLEDNDG